MDMDRSGKMFVEDHYVLCTRMQISTDAFQITMRL